MAHLECLLRQRLAVHPPLRFENGLDNITGLAAYGNLHGVVLGLDVQSCIFESLDHRDTSVEPLHSLELLTRVVVERAVVVQNVDELKFVAHADFVIVRVVCRRDLHGAGTERHIDNDVIRDDGNAAVKERVLRKLAMQVL